MFSLENHLECNYVSGDETIGLQQLIKKSAVTLMIVILAFVVNYYANIVLANFFSADVYGDFSSAASALRVISTLALLGMDYGVVRFIPEYVSISNWNLASGYLRGTLHRFLAIAASILMLGIIVSGVLYYLDREQIFLFSQHHVFFLFIWCIPFISLTIYFGKLLRGMRRSYVSIISLNITQPVVFLAAVKVIEFLRVPMTLQIVMFLFVLSLVFVQVTQLLFIYFSLPRELIGSQPTYEHKLWARVAFQLLVSSFLVSNLANLSVTLSEIFDPVEANVGAISAIFTISGALWIVYSSINTVMSPLISPAAQRHEKNTLQRLVNVSVIAGLLVGGLVVAVIFMFGEKFLMHFNPVFQSAYPALVVISFVFYFAMMMGMSGLILEFSGNQKIIVKSSIAGFLLLLVLGGALTYEYKLMGIVISVAIVQMSMVFWNVYWVKKIFKIKPLVVF